MMKKFPCLSAKCSILRFFSNFDFFLVQSSLIWQEISLPSLFFISGKISSFSEKNYRIGFKNEIKIGEKLFKIVPNCSEILNFLLANFSISIVHHFETPSPLPSSKKWELDFSIFLGAISWLEDSFIFISADELNYFIDTSYQKILHWEVGINNASVIKIFQFPMF